MGDKVCDGVPRLGIAPHETGHGMFARDKSRPDGLRRRCRDCETRACADYRARNPEQNRLRKARQRQYDRQRRAARDTQPPAPAPLSPITHQIVRAWVVLADEEWAGSFE